MPLRTLVVLLLLVSGLVGCDHATKRAAQEELRGEPPVTVVSGVLDLSYTENRDVGFSVLRWIPYEVKHPLIIGMNAAMICFFLFMWYRQRQAWWLVHVAFALVVAGALGNVTDRIARGYVVDFIHLHHWPVFNVADICITIGGPLLFLHLARARPPVEEPG